MEMNVSDTHTEQVINKACDYWGLHNTSVALVAARENRVYRVESQKGVFALRLHRSGYRTLDEIRSELIWMNMLIKHNTSVPNPISAIDGDFIKMVDGIVVDILSWVEGKPLNQIEPTAMIYHDLGVLLARMHELADAWPLPESFARPTWNLVGDAPSWGRFWENPQLTKEQQATLLDFRDYARSTLESLPQPDCGLIHADLVPDNVLYNGHQLQAIDFDDGGFGYRLFDLATITHRSKRLQSSDKLAAAVISGYQKHRVLDCYSLPLFEALRACTYVGWNISRMHEPGGAERNDRFIAEALVAVGNTHAI